jgi:hypothetical protein
VKEHLDEGVGGELGSLIRIKPRNFGIAVC